MTREEWLNKCVDWKAKWPVIQQEYLPSEDDTILNIYAVLDAINRFSLAEHILMGDAGSISYAGPVALASKDKQKFIFSPAQADMGWALPAAIGVSLASNQKVICIVGDGSFMSNLQELAVVKQHNLDIKFVILNNGGYLSIKNTQSRFFEGRVFGTSNETGLWFPNFEDVASSFKMDYAFISNKQSLEKLGVWINEKGPAILDCNCLPDQQILPAQTFKNGKQAGLHDMQPHLSDQELRKEMIVGYE